MPLEYLTLAFDMPYMLLLNDIRQGIFYALLLSFWLVFAGEHMLVQGTAERATLRTYWRHLSAVGIGCLSLFVFDVSERGGQLKNPFYSIWISHWGTNLAITFIVLGAVSAGCYFMFLCFMVWRVFRNIGAKRTALPTMSAARRLHYEGIIYRFKFLMLTTLVCAAMTVVGFVMGQVRETDGGCVGGCNRCVRFDRWPKDSGAGTTTFRSSLRRRSSPACTACGTSTFWR